MNPIKILKEQTILTIKKLNKTPYIICNKINTKQCYVCEELTKTTSHHILPLRVKVKNPVLRNLRVKLCNNCEKKVHMENEKIDGFNIIKKQAVALKKLREEKKKTFIPLKQFLEDRKKDLIKDCKKIPNKLKDNPKSIHPALKKVEGRIHEIEYIESYLYQNVFRNRKY